MAAPQNFVSVSRRPPDVEDYIDILRRYRSWVIGPTFAGLVISVVVACYLPNVYVCRASMRIKPSVLPDDLLAAQSSGRMRERFGELRQEILGRDNLITLMMNPKLDLYKNERAHLPTEDVAEQYVAKNVHISEIVVADNSNRGAQAFAISFTYPDRVKSYKVVQELINQIQNKEAVLQTNQATSTTTVVDDLLEKAQARMDQANQELAAFSAQNQGKLPENFEKNMMDVDTKNAALIRLNDDIAQEKQHQNLLESEMQNNKNTQSSIQMSTTIPQTVNNSAVKNTSLINLESAINQKDGECIAMQRQYQPTYPKVQACLEQKKALEDRRDEIERTEGTTVGGGSSVKMVPNDTAVRELNGLKADYNNLQAQYNASVLMSDNKTRQAVETQQQLKIAQDKVAASPAIIQKYQVLNQALRLATEDYERKSKSKETSQTQSTVEGHGAGETLEILESPITPESPVSPTRGAIIGVGTVIGLVLGFALAGAKEIKNTSLKNLKDVRAYTNLPVLSSIPLLENALLVRRKRRLAWLAWSTAVIVGGVAMCVAVYYQYVFVAAQVG